MKKSKAFSNAQKRNWAKFRVNGMLATCKAIASGGNISRDEEMALRDVMAKLRRLLNRWEPTI